jgi:CheY-like chemotaxis protein
MKYQHLLIVEDDPMSAELLRDWLEGEGYRVTSARTLGEGMIAFHPSPPTLVLLDVNLGPEDGLDLAMWIRQQPALKHIPIIAVTAHAMIAEKERTLRAGCNAIVSKPVDFQTLRQQIEQLTITSGIS